MSGRMQKLSHSAHVWAIANVQFAIALNGHGSREIEQCILVDLNKLYTTENIE